MVAAGDSTPRGEDSAFRFAVVTKGSAKGLGTFRACGLAVISCAIPVGETAVGVGLGVRRPPVITEENIYPTKVTSQNHK